MTFDHQQMSPQISVWQRMVKMFQYRHVGLISLVWCALLLVSVIGASGVLQPVAFGMVSSVSRTFMPHDKDGRTNILLLGVGDKDHAGASLTDSIIIASIEPATRSIVFLSLPRDLYLVDSDQAQDARINAFYANVRNRLIREGASASGASLDAMNIFRAELGTRLGVQMHGVMKVDFTAFSEIVDAFGGVEIDVTEALTDYTYPLKEGVVGTFSLPQGLQRLDGETALKYARSRHSTSDFDRSRRQQQILGALLEKVKNQNPLENLGLARAVLGVIEKHAEWTLSSRDLIALASSALTVPEERIVSMHLSTSVGGDYADAERGGFVLPPAEDIGAGAILLPYSLSGKLSDWGQIETLTKLLFGHRGLYLSESDITVSAGAKDNLAAHRLRNELVRYGLSVSQITQTVSGSGEILVSSRGQTEKFLSRYVDIPLTVSDTMENNSMNIILPARYRFVPLEKSDQM